LENKTHFREVARLSGEVRAELPFSGLSRKEAVIGKNLTAQSGDRGDWEYVHS
jgi:hypothetical protein